jgi:hypothetical protein
MMMGPMMVNLITHYGQVTREQVRQHVEGYMMLQDRRAQQSGMLFLFITNSLDQDALNIMDIDKAPYTINNMPDGVCFLKEIITKAYVDTNATVDTIRKAISRLDDKIKELKFDIKVFNAYVKGQVNSLAAHGIQCTELLTNLFAAYNQVQDAEFAQHVRLYYFNYTSSNLRGQPQDITNELMLAMEQNYHRRVMEGTWNPKQLKTDKERIIALDTTIAELNANKGNTSSTEKKKDGPPAWKKTPPAAGAEHTIKKNKKEYHWCPKHKMWCIHRPDQCQLLGNGQQPVANETVSNASDSSSITPSTTTEVPPPMRIDPVLQTFVSGTGRIFS